MEITDTSKCLNCGKVLGFQGVRLLKLKAEKCNMQLKDMAPMCARCSSISNQFRNNFSESEL